MSLIKAATLEQAKRRGHKGETPQDNAGKRARRRRIVLTLITATILVALGGAAFGLVALVSSERSQTNAPFLPENSIMFAEQTFAVPLGGSSAASLLQQLAHIRRSVELTLGAITRLVPTVVDADTDQAFEREATAQEFLTAINASAPEDITRFLTGEIFLGIHTIDESSPVLVLPIASYERIFAGMLEWENTLNNDFVPLFTRVPHQVRDQEGNLILNRFSDVVIRNYDVRVLRDTAGEIRMLYAFPTQHILIIAESPHTFVETLSRLRAERRI